MRASPDPEDYNADDFCPQNRVFASDQVSGAHFIVALEKKQVTIRGRGRIDGSARSWLNKPVRIGKRISYQYPAWRPGQMLFFCECQDLTIDGPQLFDAPYWNCLLLGCEDVMIRDLRIQADMMGHNGDGINIDCCRRVLVSGCLIEGSDDCIAVRASASQLNKAKACEYVNISDCILKTYESGVRVGVGDGLIRRVKVSNLQIQGASVGICVCSRWRNGRGADIEDLAFDNICMDVERPFNINSMVSGNRQNSGNSGYLSRISFRNICALGTHSSLVCALPNSVVSDISFMDVNLRLSGGEDAKGQNWYDGSPAMPAAFYLENAANIEFDRVRLDWISGRENWRHAIDAKAIKNLRVENCQLQKPTRKRR